MKKASKYMYLIISIFVFTLYLGNVKATEYINYYNITMTSQEYNNLLNLGFSEEEIHYMSEDTFNSNKDLSGEVVARSDKYYKTIYTDLNGNSQSIEISKNEYNNQSGINQRGTVSTEYKNMVSTITALSNTYRYKVSLLWNNFPAKRSYDVIGIGFYDDVYISSPLYFGYHYCVAGSSCYDSTQYYYRQTTSTGGSVAYKLPSESLVSLSAVLYYDVSKDTNNTITVLDMYGDYAHAIKDVNYAIYSDHAINYGGINFGVNNHYYDEIPCARTTIGVNW